MILLLISIGLGAAAFLFYNQLTMSQMLNNELTATIDANTQTVYVATRLINKGEEIIAEGEEANVEMQTIYTGLEEYNYITDWEVGSVAVVPIDEGVPVLCNFVGSNLITVDEREYEVAVVDLATNQENYDFIDIRICYPNGEDYLVLPKRQIENLNMETCTFTTILNEEEILRFHSAIIDAFTVSGTRLYTTKYLESNLQDEATPTYLVRAETLDILAEDPNVLTKAVETLNLQARMSLESRLGNLPEDNLEAVADGWQLSDTANGAVLLNEEESVYDENGNLLAEDEYYSDIDMDSEEDSESEEIDEEDNDERNTDNAEGIIN